MFVSVNSITDSLSQPNKVGNIMAKPKPKNKGCGKSNGVSVENSPAKSSVVSGSESEDESQTDTPIQGSQFKVEVKTSLRKLTKAFFGDIKTKSVGLIKRVEDVEGDLYGKKDPNKGVVPQVKSLEDTLCPRCT